MIIKDFLESYSFQQNGFADEDIKLIIVDSCERIEHEITLGDWRMLPYYIAISKIDYWRIVSENYNDDDNTIVTTVYINRK